MDFDDFLDPYRPFNDEVDTLLSFHDEASPDWTLKQFTPVFRSLYKDDRDFHGDDQPEQLTDRVLRFLAHVKHLSSTAPMQDELDRAPRLHRWCAVRSGFSPLLLGHVTGHPKLREGARALTSVLFQVAQDHSWARTWNRFYSLVDYTPETLFAMQAEGKVRPSVELLHLKDRLH